MLDPKVQEIIAQIESRFSDSRFSLKSLARDHHLSLWHLSRCLSQHDSLGFQRRLHAARTAEAARLLRETNLSIKEIAARVGYRNQAHLCRHYKVRFGRTPSNARGQFHKAGQAQ